MKKIRSWPKLLDQFTQKLVHEFEDYVVSWGASIEESETHEFLDDIFSTLIEEKIRSSYLDLSDDFLQLSNNILKKNSFTNNPHLKCEFLKIVLDYSRGFIQDSIYENVLILNKHFKEIMLTLPDLICYIKEFHLLASLLFNLWNGFRLKGEQHIF